MRAKIEEKSRYAAIILREEGYSLREIAQKLGFKSDSTVRTILDRYKETGLVKDRYRCGRPKISNDRNNRILIRLMKQNRKLSSTELAKQWIIDGNVLASPRSVRRVLHDNGYVWRSACKKPRLSSKQKIARKKWCKERKSYTQTMWRTVLFSDEMNVEVDSRKGRVMLRRTTKERFEESCILKRTKQGSGSIGIWACMGYNGVKFFKLFTGRLNAESYINILGDYLLPSIDILQENNQVTFQQDNAPCHTAKIVKDWFNENSVKTMPWPANSPDLNCIENLWSWLDHHLEKLQIYNLEQLKFEITNLLDNVPLEIVHRLIDSMPNRIHECLKANGGSTSY